MKNASLIIMVAVLFLVTAVREIALFTSFVEHHIDVLMAGAFAVALVIGKLALAAAAADYRQVKNSKMQALCLLLIAPLMVISIAGTALYFESAFQQQNTSAKSSSVEYQQTLDLIDQKKTSIAQLKTIASASADKGNTWAAGQHLKTASYIETELADLLTRLNNIQPQTNAATVGGNRLNESRWLAWLGLAVLADLLQIVGIVILKTPTVRVKQNTSTEQNETPNVTAKQNTTAKHHAPAKRQTQTKQNSNWLREQIEHMGIVPSVREAQAAGIGYQKYTQEINRLAELGMVQKRARGKGWVITGEAN